MANYKRISETPDKQIKRVINEPQTSSSLVTNPTHIAVGENITLPIGRQVVVAELTVEGTLNNDGILVSVGSGL